jgi:hypothetical protein
MPRLLIIAILAASSTLSLSTQAQMRGGAMGARGGGMGGRVGAVGRGPAVSGRPAPAMSGARSVGAPRVGGVPRFSGVPRGSRVVANGGRFGVHNRPFFNNHCFGAFPCRNRFFFNNGFGFVPGFGFPGFGWAYPYSYYPGLYSSDYFQEPQAQQPIVVSGGNDQGNTQLAVEVQRLSDEIEYMRQEQSRQSQARQPGVSLSARSAAPTTFVFRDGRKMTTENYAIAGQTLWVFNDRAARRFPLSDLDRGATEQANAENGLDLHLPEPEP